MTITMEVGDIKRFKTEGDFASYCRLVDAQHLSNGKRKADNNSKCGNKYLSWAFVEASNFARRYDESCRRWYDRKAAKTSKIIATKALGCKLAKAAWHMMAKQTDYDAKRMFPELAVKKGLIGSAAVNQKAGWTGESPVNGLTAAALVKRGGRR
jgi:hypothetical protein